MRASLWCPEFRAYVLLVGYLLCAVVYTTWGCRDLWPRPAGRPYSQVYNHVIHRTVTAVGSAGLPQQTGG